MLDDNAEKRKKARIFKYARVVEEYRKKIKDYKEGDLEEIKTAELMRSLTSYHRWELECRYDGKIPREAVLIMLNRYIEEDFDF
jgi:hypothetical protein